MVEEIKVKLTYDFQEDYTFICKKDVTIGELCEKLSNEHEIDFDQVYILMNGSYLDQTHFDDPIGNYINSMNSDTLTILIYKNTTVVPKNYHLPENKKKTIIKRIDIHRKNTINKNISILNKTVHNPINILNSSNVNNPASNENNPPNNANNPEINTNENLGNNNENLNNSNNNNIAVDKDNNLNSNINNNNTQSNNPPVEISTIPKNNIEINKANTNNSRKASLNTEINSSDRDLIQIKVNFEFKSQVFLIQPCNLDNKLSDLCQDFANDKKSNLNSFNFFYKNIKLDLSKTLNDIIDENGKNAKEMKINEEENNDSFFQKKQKNIINKSYSSGYINCCFHTNSCCSIKKKEKKRRRKK